MLSKEKLISVRAANDQKYRGLIMFKIIMLIAVGILAVAWIIYGIYEWKLRTEEKKHPRRVSDRLQKTRSELADWAQKMAKFEKTTHPASNQNKGEKKT